MDLLIATFNTILYRPLFNILVLLYEYLPGHDFGLAVIVLTILIKFIFYPLGAKAIKSQKALSGLQPKIKEIQEKYKDNKEEQTKALMALYKKEKINPFSGCLPLLIQLPVLLALYRVFWRGLQPEAMVLLYNFVPNPGIIDSTFFGFVNLSQPNVIMAFLTGIVQFVQIKMSSPNKPDRKQSSGFADQMQKQMQYFMPFFVVLILLRLPSAIGLYWLVTTLFTIIQQYVILKHDESR